MDRWNKSRDFPFSVCRLLFVIAGNDLSNDKRAMENPFSSYLQLHSPFAILKLIDSQSFDAQVERRGRKAQSPSGSALPGDSAARGAQRGLNRGAFLSSEPFIQVPHEIAIRKRVPFDTERAVAGENDRPFDDVF